jgi:formamidopyrimidine-DNA glycosylase
LIRSDAGTLIIHLGMSGHLRFVNADTEPKKHDHVDIELDSGDVLRFNDPRRFGCLLWTDTSPLEHPLLKNLGPEPLENTFTGSYLYTASRNRRIAIKPHLMNAAIVVGVGNIYASESLFRAGIHPARAAGRISLERMSRLTEAVKLVLQESIRFGGTTLRDFYSGDGKPGYFRNELNVYDREGEACINCDQPIRQVVLGQRSTFYCPVCQK